MQSQHLIAARHEVSFYQSLRPVAHFHRELFAKSLRFEALLQIPNQRDTADKSSRHAPPML